MRTKHFIDDPERLVDDFLRSLPLVNPACRVDIDNRIAYAPACVSNDRVAVVSGGGSGHEPSFSGYVGPGILSAAVAGTIFASPSAEQVLVGITSRVDAEKGILVVVMNYTGDILNFCMAVEKAKAAGSDVEIGRAHV